MKITDITLTLFTWSNLPKISYGAHAAGGGETKMGLLAIETDEGVTGHAFLGSATPEEFLFFIGEAEGHGHGPMVST